LTTPRVRAVLAPLPRTKRTSRPAKAPAFFRRTGKSIVLFTVGDILNEQLARKLA
jgi:hypothetical protein